MNTKGMKFLAVLAVLAMAFAAFAVVAPAETDDASTPTATAWDFGSGHTSKLTLGDDGYVQTATDGATLTAGKYYYVPSDMSITITDTAIAGQAVLLLLENGATVDVKMDNSDGTATIYVHVLGVTKSGDVLSLHTDYSSTNAIKAAWAKSSAYTEPQIVASEAGDPATCANQNFAIAAGDDTTLRFVEYNHITYASCVVDAVVSDIMHVTGAFDKMWNGYGNTSVFDYYKATGTITSTEAGGAQKVKINDFTGQLSVSSAGIVTVSKWDAGNIEVVKAGNGSDVIIASGCSAGTLTIDSDAYAKTSNGTINYNLNVNGSGTFAFGAAPTITKALTSTIQINTDAMSVTIGSGGILTAPLLVANNGASSTILTITANTGGVYNGTITYDSSTDANDATVYAKVKGGTNALSIAKGSIKFTGDLAGTDNLIQGIKNVELAANGSALNVNANGVLTLAKDFAVKGTINVPATATLKTATGSTVDVSNANATIYVDGTLDIGGTVVQTDATKTPVTGGGEVNIGANADVTSVKFSTSLNIDADPNAMTEMTVGGLSDSSITKIGPTQIVKVSGSWTLVKGAEFTIMGELQVPAGTTLTIQEGAKLIIDAGAKAELKGTVLIAAAVGTTAAGELEIKNGSADVYGKVTVNGLLTITKGELTIMEGSDFTVSKTGKIDEAANGLVVVSKGAVLTNNGVIKIANQNKGIQNSGTVVYNTNIKAESAMTIYMAANDAVVDIQKYTVADGNENFTITIDDTGLVYYKDKVNDTEYKVETDLEPVEFYTARNKIVISFPAITPGNLTGTSNPATDVVGKIFGVKVVEKVSSFSSETSYGMNGFVAVAEKIFTNKMDLSGDLTVTSVHTEGQVSEQSATGKVLISAAQEVDITDSFTVGVNTTLDNESVNAVDHHGAYGTKGLVVSGTVDATAVVGTVTSAMTNTGTVTLSGDGLVTCLATLAGTVNSVKFETGTTTPIYNYVTIDKALYLANAVGNTIDEFYVLGTDTVTVSATIPEDVSFILSGATLNIGSKAGDDVTLTVKEDGTLMGGTGVTVNGTLFAENKTNVVITGNNIVSDVLAQEIGIDGKVVSDGWARWTNITAALNQAEPGSVVTISKATDGNDYVVITGNTEIKNGVTLVVPSNVAPLKLKDGVTLTINGELVTALDIYAETKFDFTARNLTGTDGKASAIVVKGALEMDSILSLPYGAGVGNQITLGAPIVGAYYAIDGYKIVSPLSVALNNIDDVLSNIVINGPVTGGDLVFEATDYASAIVIGNDAIGTVVSSLTVTSLTLDGAKLGDNGTTFGAFSGKLKVGDNVITAVGVKNLKVQDKSDKMLLTSASIPKDMKLNISAGSVYASAMTVSGTSGTFTVDAGASLIADGGADAATTIDKLTVNGTLSVPNSKVLTVTTLTLFGTLDVAPATSTKTAGSMSVKDMYVGLKKTDYYSTSAAAAISGPFNANTGATIIVLDGTTIDSAAQAVFDGMAKSSKFYVESKLWFTVYTPTSGTTITVNKAPIENAILEGWATKAGGDVSVSKNDAITIGDKAAYYAVIDYDIYNVTIITDTGIKSVAIDNIEMIRDGNSNIFKAFTNNLGVKLEEGTHTVTYTLYNGYEGTAQLYTMDNTVLKDLKFTCSGTDELNYSFQLYGTEQIVTPEPTPVEQNEWTITTILLVILVILIAIMAVIVALRLNRS